MIRRSYDGPLSGALGALQQRVVACRNCPRLVEYRERKATSERRASLRDWDYWGAPVPGSGDPAARLLVVGLAPASHGANRTGRMFTGDPTADFLTRALHRAGFANQATSQHRGDGLELIDAFMTAAARCAPPDDKPATVELAACGAYLREETALLPNVRAVLVLGRIAFDRYLRTLPAEDVPRPRPAFAHGGRCVLGDGQPVLFSSYHPSPRNTNTGRLTEAGLDAVLSQVRAELGA